MSDNWAENLSASEMIEALEAWGNEGVPGSELFAEAARRLDALRWRDADPPPTDGRIRWVATLLGAEKGYYDESAGKWRVWQSRPLSAPEQWYDDVRVTAYLDWYRPPIELPYWREEADAVNTGGADR